MLALVGRIFKINLTFTFACDKCGRDTSFVSRLGANIPEAVQCRTCGHNNEMEV